MNIVLCITLAVDKENSKLEEGFSKNLENSKTAFPNFRMFQFLEEIKWMHPTSSFQFIYCRSIQKLITVIRNGKQSNELKLLHLLRHSTTSSIVPWKCKIKCKRLFWEKGLCRKLSLSRNSKVRVLRGNYSLVPIRRTGSINRHSSFIQPYIFTKI